MIKNFRRRLARWRSTPAGWIWPLAVVATIAAAALAFRWWRALPPTPPTVSYSVFLQRLQQGAVESITVIPGSEVRGVWSRPVGDEEAGSTFRVEYPTFEVTPVLDRAERAGTPATLERRSGVNAEFWREVLVVAVALLLFGFILRRQMTGGSEMGSIGAARRSHTTFGGRGRSRGHGGGAPRAGGVPEGARSVPGRRRPHAEGRADVRPARDRQDPDGPRGGGRGGRAVLRDQRQ